MAVTGRSTLLKKIMFGPCVYLSPGMLYWAQRPANFLEKPAKFLNLRVKIKTAPCPSFYVKKKKKRKNLKHTHLFVFTSVAAGVAH